MISSQDLRQKYLDFFKSKGHAIIPSASLIPENDPSVLFTTAGMHPLVPYLLGEKHPEGQRLASVQKCVRLQDIDEVGDNRHDTFFEMLGNWSLGYGQEVKSQKSPPKADQPLAEKVKNDDDSDDGVRPYWKKTAIEYSWEFLTSPDWLGLDPKKIAVTVFAGDADPAFGGAGVPRDEESAGIWQSLGVPGHKVAYLGKKDNWWGPAGQTGPCGPDTEIFFWKGESEYPPAGSNPGTDEDNWLEIWNNVFMQYNKVHKVKSQKSIKFGEEISIYKPLKQKNVDTGMGLERTLVVSNDFVDVFQIDTLWPLIQKIQEISGHEYIEGGEIIRAMRIVADHLRTVTMIMGDDKGIAPSNTDQGYIVRRLIRRAVRHGRVLGIKENFCSPIAEVVIKIFQDIYPEVARNRDFVLTEISKEESKFRNTIESGIRNYELRIRHLGESKVFPAKEAFDLYQSYGFPIEMIDELAREQGLRVDLVGLENEMKHHQDLSRAGAEAKFKGGLADQGEMSVKYHTATHLLHAALRKVLGAHVEQRGSNITTERLRFDFSHPEKLSEDQKREVEDLVNYAIKQAYPVSFEEMSVAEAKAKGATGLFEDKYGNKVKVYTVGDSNTLPDAHVNSLTFSMEICGGPHVKNTGELGVFKIIKEEASSAGIRRIKAILE